MSKLLGLDDEVFGSRSRTESGAESATGPAHGNATGVCGGGLCENAAAAGSGGLAANLTVATGGGAAEAGATAAAAAAASAAAASAAAVGAAGACGTPRCFGAGHCCGQFLVSRAAVRSRPRRFYQLARKLAVLTKRARPQPL